MKAVQFVLCGFAMFLPIAAAMASPAARQPISIVFPPEAQDVNNVAGSYLPLVARSPADTWAVVTVVSDPYSGVGNIDPSTGHGAMPIFGSYKVVNALGSPFAKTTGKYSWSRQLSIMPVPDVEKVTGAKAFDANLSGFFIYQSVDGEVKSATRDLLCILNESAPGQDMFAHVHLIPTGWVGDVPPAVQYLRSHPSLIHPTKPASWTQVRSLLHNANPCLVVTALQLLAVNKQLTPADMSAALATNDPVIIGCSVMLSQLYAPAGPDRTAPDANTQWLTDQVPKIQTMAQLEGVVTGIFNLTWLGRRQSVPMDLPDVPSDFSIPAYYSPDNFSPPLWKSGSITPLMASVRQKLNQLDAHGDATDAQWAGIDSVCRMLHD